MPQCSDLIFQKNVISQLFNNFPTPLWAQRTGFLFISAKFLKYFLLSGPDVSTDVILWTPILPFVMVHMASLPLSVTWASSTPMWQHKIPAPVTAIVNVGQVIYAYFAVLNVI